MTAVTVRPLRAFDRAAWLKMRTTLYVDEAGDEAIGLDEDIDKMLADEAWGAFAAEAPGGQLIGFIELYERNYAESCSTSPVTYIEGIWVAPGWRRRGVARSLLAAGMAWGRARGRTEIASDVQLANLISQAVHRRLGFEETERLVTYRAAIPPAGRSSSPPGSMRATDAFTPRRRAAGMPDRR
jgi:aminoglycoside 6'-N-acetyltransferase I